MPARRPQSRSSGKLPVSCLGPHSPRGVGKSHLRVSLWFAPRVSAWVNPAATASGTTHPTRCHDFRFDRAPGHRTGETEPRIHGDAVAGCGAPGRFGCGTSFGKGPASGGVSKYRPPSIRRGSPVRSSSAISFCLSSARMSLYAGPPATFVTWCGSFFRSYSSSRGRLPYARS